MSSGLSQKELDALYDTCAPVIFRRARRLLGRDADAHDAVQEVLVRIWKASDQFRREARPMTWVYRITTNVCLNMLRARSTRAAAEVSEAGTTDLEAVETRSLLAKWLTGLTERESTVATLLYIDGLTQDEVADVLGVSRKTIVREVQELRAKAASLDALPASEVPRG